MDARKITKKQMSALAWLLLSRDGTGYQFVVANPEVRWEIVVDRNRSRVRIYGNYMLVFEQSRKNLLLLCSLKGISL
ncbi:hypothetical protein GTP45_10715 [Pseudoduganella sp. FT55W]|uniref:Uncharacterized protein n=1 Tax=Duganella rivi TaxID=2666083 RepID=A0A7X4GPJ3_9BURK|nr:hypothetical protein [Duganella rivi]MYM67302.1 hypothetical protein [Duganella rivi]